MTPDDSIYVVPARKTGHECDLPHESGGYGGTGHPERTLVQCLVCHQWWWSAPCFEHFGPTSKWRKVRWYHFLLRRKRDEAMSTPMYDIPDHYAIPVDEKGRGPVFGSAETYTVTCSCGDAECVEHIETIKAVLGEGPARATLESHVDCRGCRMEAIGLLPPESSHNHPPVPDIFRGS